MEELEKTQIKACRSDWEGSFDIEEDWATKTYYRRIDKKGNVLETGEESEDLRRLMATTGGYHKMTAINAE